MQDRAVDDVEGETDLAEILGEWVNEEFLDFLGAVDAEDDEDGANGLRETVRFWVGSWGEFRGPHVEGGPFVACVRGRTQVETENEDREPEFAGGYAETV